MRLFPLPHRRLILIPISICLALILLSLRYQAQARNQASFLTPADRLRPLTTHAFDRISPTIHFLIPATASNVELCKSLASVLVLDYPIPVLVNWGKVFDKHNWRANGTHIGVIEGSLDYLKSLSPERDNDLVLIADGYDQWFQLRPEIVLSRYRSINRGLMERTERKMGRKAVMAEGVSQSILFSAEKGCGPLKNLEDEILCYGQPESPLRNDLYGEDTDRLDPKTHLPLHMRPSFLNGGFTIGPVLEMKALLERATFKIKHSVIDHGGSNQHIYNEILGEQEYQRAVIRRRHQPFLSKAADILRKIIGTYQPTLIDPHPTHKHMEHLEGHPLEFGVGLDYGLELAMPAVFSEFDGRFIMYNDSEAVASGLYGSGPSPPRVSSLPADIAASTETPFYGLIQGSHTDSWHQVPLYTNIWTASVPVALHMNGLKSMRTTLWDDMWITPHLREFFDAKKIKGVRDDQGNKLLWAEICGQYEKDVFRLEHVDAEPM